MLTIEQYVQTVNISSQVVKVDYNAVMSFCTRTKYRICEVFMLTA